MKLLPKTCALFSLLCASALVLCSCSGRGTPPQAAQSTPSPAPSVDTSGFQQNMCVSNVFRMNSVCQTPFGYYLQSEGIVYALDPQTKRMAPVCSRPECRHGDEHCNGWINSLFLSYYNGMVYYANSDSEDCWHLYAMQPDGTGHRKIQSIQFEATGMIHSYQPMLYNGTVYFIDSGALYSVALGADIHTAVRLLAEDSTGKLESSWKFWADDSAAYAMNHVLRADGVYQDVLYQLGTDEAGTKELWRSSQTQVPQQRDSCSSWYISHGQLYYYASGNDVWRIDLNSGQAHQLIGLTGVLESGTAVFSQSAVAVLNDTPDPQWGPQSGYRSGGDTLRIYDYGQSPHAPDPCPARRKKGTALLGGAFCSLFHARSTPRGAKRPLRSSGRLRAVKHYEVLRRFGIARQKKRAPASLASALLKVVTYSDTKCTPYRPFV